MRAADEALYMAKRQGRNCVAHAIAISGSLLHNNHNIALHNPRTYPLQLLRAKTQRVKPNASRPSIAMSSNKRDSSGGLRQIEYPTGHCAAGEAICQMVQTSVLRREVPI
jgi:hypothetical protein